MSSPKHNTPWFSFNLRQKMIGCLLLHVLFYTIAGTAFIKDFRMFNDDVTLLMHAGDLNRICFKIRLYEENFMINQDSGNLQQALVNIESAQKLLPVIAEELKIMSAPEHLDNVSLMLDAYRQRIMQLKKDALASESRIERQELISERSPGQELIDITDSLVAYEKKQMSLFIDSLTRQLLEAVVVLLMLSGFTIVILYRFILKPLKMLENAAVSISMGDFSMVPLDSKKSEITSVLQAFNKMVADLEQKQEQLFQAKKLSSIDTLASGTAHQINNPLNNIATSCQLALSELEGDKSTFAVKMLETIDHETKRAAEIVRCLLEFSRAQTFSPEVLELEEILHKVEMLVKSEIPSGIILDIDVEDNTLLCVDEQKMVDALLNLIINAIQAIGKPPGSISVRGKKDRSVGKVTLTVSDTGSGIDKENISKIFDPFFTTKSAKNGTGLGLAVVYGIIQKQNGTIRVESEKGKGTRFIITLPLHQQRVGEVPDSNLKTDRNES